MVRCDVLALPVAKAWILGGGLWHEGRLVELHLVDGREDGDLHTGTRIERRSMGLIPVRCSIATSQHHDAIEPESTRAIVRRMFDCREAARIVGKIGRSDALEGGAVQNAVNPRGGR